MKKMLFTLLLAGVTSMSLCFPGHCTHVHNEDCGPDGVNCTHECVTVHHWKTNTYLINR